MHFQNKVFVVTGAGGGLGRQLVIQLLAKGASVAAVDINLQALEETKSRAGENAGRVSIHQVDITDRTRVRLLPEEVKRIHGTVDGLINNAGVIQDFVTVVDMEDHAVERIMKINFFGMMNMTRAFVSALAQQNEAIIANVSSMGGFLPVPGQAIYGASKAAVKIATEGLRMELSHTPIAVSLVIPGGIETDIKKNSGLVDAEVSEEAKKSAGIQLTTPKKAAEIILKGLAKEKAKILVGADCTAMDLLYRLIPGQATKLISGVMAKNHGKIFSDPSVLRQRPI